MGKAMKAKKVAAPVAAANDPTPERMRHGQSEVVPVLRRAGEVITGTGSTRRMTPYLDILRNVSAITWTQHYAATWWQERHEEALGNAKVCGDYGQSNGARGTGDPSPLPLSDKAQRARDLRDAAKRALSVVDRMAVEEACEPEHDTLDRGQGAIRLCRWRRGLSALAVHLKVEAHPLTRAS
jgi:hypothetical protein